MKLNMNYSEAATKPEVNDAIIVKADEVDEAGIDISTISPADSSGAEFDKRIESRRAQDAQAGGSPKRLTNAISDSFINSNRPGLRRDGSATLPPQQPPPPAPSQQEDPGNSTDSLSLVQLRRLLTDLPKLEPAAYAYEYKDTRTFPEELEEWFQYTEEERFTLLRAKKTFSDEWEKAQATVAGSLDGTVEWTEVGSADRQRYLYDCVQALASSEASVRVRNLECISYVALGTWETTAGLEVQHGKSETYDDNANIVESRYCKSKLQLDWIYSAAELLCNVGAVQSLIDVLKRHCEND